MLLVAVALFFAIGGRASVSVEVAHVIFSNHLDIGFNQVRALSLELTQTYPAPASTRLGDLLMEVMHTRLSTDTSTYISHWLLRQQMKCMPTAHGTSG